MRIERADRVMSAHILAAVAIFGAAVAMGALRSPVLTALACAATAWTALYGAMTGLKIIRHMCWQLRGDEITRWVPVFYAVFVGLIGGGLDAAAQR